MLMNKISPACLALILLVTPVLAQNTGTLRLPSTEAGQRVAAYIKAFNSGDEQQMRAFFAENVSPHGLERRSVDERLGIYKQMRGQLETMELRRVLEATEVAVTVLIQTKKGEWFEIGFQFEAESPHKLVGLRVEDREAPAGGAQVNTQTPATPLTEGEALALVEKQLSELVSADEFSGTVIIAKGDRPVLQKAYGLASLEYNVPNRIDTKFNLGSINKIFTQVAIGQLVEQGKLSFDDTLGKHLPDYPNRVAADKVTIRHLLDMASGIGDFFGPEFEAMPKDRLRTIKDFLPLFAGKPLEFEPGTKHQYSNGGYIVLGAIVEKVSAQDYYDYVREHIFKPAGMQNTDWYEADLPTPNMASGYTREGMEGKKARRNNLYTRPAKGSPAGGGYSTAEDLFKFALALQAGKLRQPEFREAKNSHPGNTTVFKGLGIGGGAPGINALLLVGASAKDYTVILMSNYDPPSAEAAGKKIRGLLARVKN